MNWRHKDCETTMDHPDNFSLLKGDVTLERDFLLSNTYLKAGDSAFVGGSLIEGIGNRYSDVDVHVICESLLREREIDVLRHYRVLSPDRTILTGAQPDANVFLIHTLIPGTSIKVDVEYRTESDVEQLADTIGGVYDYALQSPILLTKYLPVRELAFVHRLFAAKDIFGTSSLDALREKIGLHRFLYLMYRWKASDYAVLIDLLGAWENDELDRCVDLARENAVTQFHAYTHLLGNSNYHRKWILPYAKRHGVSEAIMERFVSLLLGRMLNDDAEKRGYVLESLDFVDAIFEATSTVFRTVPHYPSGASACARLDGYLRNSEGEYSEMEVAYRKKAYGEAVVPTRSWFAAP